MADLLVKCLIIHYAAGLSLHCVLSSVLVSMNAEILFTFASLTKFGSVNKILLRE